MPPSLRAQVSAALLHLRAAAGLSLEGLRRHTNLARPALNKLERGITGDLLDTIENYAAGCGGRLVVVAAGKGEHARAELAEAVADLELGDVVTLLRLVHAREVLPASELELLADATDLRVAALKRAERTPRQDSQAARR